MKLRNALIKTTTVLCCALTIACTDQADEQSETGKVYQDEEHRPAEWSCDLKMTLDQDTINDQMEWLVIREQQGEVNAADLLSQLWMMAFSGDAVVYAPDLFGEIDRNQQLNPADLIDYLKAMDTLMVEDLNTGELRDTVVDVSFEQKHVNAINVHMSCTAAEGELMLQPTHVALGEQVFDGAGFYRGMRTKFFIELAAPEVSDADFNHQWVLQSDSNGFIGAHGFRQFMDGEQRPLQDWILNHGGAMEVRLQMDMDFANRRIKGRLSSVPKPS